ncbi:MAG: beta-propeller domain-containing protein [Oscillospiraceae bacterium]
MFSARFDGDYGYLCTYRQTDPVFAVDLTAPTDPRVVGELKPRAAIPTICTSGQTGCSSASAWRRRPWMAARPWTA